MDLNEPDRLLAEAENIISLHQEQRDFCNHRELLMRQKIALLEDLQKIPADRKEYIIKKLRRANLDTSARRILMKLEQIPSYEPARPIESESDLEDMLAKSKFLDNRSKSVFEIVKQKFIDGHIGGGDARRVLHMFLNYPANSLERQQGETLMQYINYAGVIGGKNNV